MELPGPQQLAKMTPGQRRKARKEIRKQRQKAGEKGPHVQIVIVYLTVADNQYSSSHE